MSRSTVILAGVASLLLLTWITVALRHGPIETDLIQRVERALAAYAITGLNIEAEGRELRLSGEMPHKTRPRYAADVARRVWGVRTVDISGLTQRLSLLDAGDPLSARLDPRRIVRLGGDLSNPMNAGTCQRTMARLAAAGSIAFEVGGASPLAESYPLLNDLATVAYQCPRTRIVIGAHTDSAGEREFNLNLSRARANAVGEFFYLAGIAAARMQIMAHGDSQPIASNATEAGRAANRRITFDMLPVE